MALFFSGVMLLLFIAVGSFRQMGTFGVETDFYWAYAPDAQRIMNGEMPQEPGVGPLYAMLLVLVNFVTGDWFASGKMISIFSTVLCGWFTFKTIGNLFSPKIGFFTLILWYATVASWALIASTDMFFAALVSAAIYFLFRSENFTHTNLALSAVFMGLAFLTRHNAVVLPIVVAFAILFLNPEAWNWKARVRGTGLFAIVFFAVYAPWMIVQSFASGTPVRSDSYLIIASHFYGQPGIVASEDMRIAAKKFDSLSSVIFYDLAYFIRHYVTNIYRHFYDILIKSLKFPAFLFVGAGAVLLLPKLNKRQLTFFLFPALSFLLLCLVHYEPRYYLYIISFFVLFAVYFLFSDSLKAHSRNVQIARVTAFIITVGFLTLFSAREIKACINDEPRELLTIAERLRDMTSENESIIARKPHIGFLTGLETKYFPQAQSVSELLAFAKQEQVDYLFYGEMESAMRPELRALLEPEKMPAAFEAILIWHEPEIVVYRLRI